MTSKCFVCNKELNISRIYICKEHTEELLHVYSQQNESIIKEPNEKEHCSICGEWNNREIINYPGWLNICNICLNKAKEVYKL